MIKWIDLEHVEEVAVVLERELYQGNGLALDQAFAVEAENGARLTLYDCLAKGLHVLARFNESVILSSMTAHEVRRCYILRLLSLAELLVLLILLTWLGACSTWLLQGVLTIHILASYIRIFTIFSESLPVCEFMTSPASLLTQFDGPPVSRFNFLPLNF